MAIGAIAVAAGLSAQEDDAEARWAALNADLVAAYRAGEYARGATLAEEALETARSVFGARHPDTLTSLNNLAAIYDAQGRLGEAEPLYTRALDLRREVLGARHPDTLQSLNNLAFLYQAQGRLGEAGRSTRAPSISAARCWGRSIQTP